jgi:transcriptional pleiotropic regulator of transition state genes
MHIVERRIDKLGRIVLPMDFRKRLGLEGEATVVLDIIGDAITVRGADYSCKLCDSIIEVSRELKICSRCIRKIKSAT